MVTPQSVQGHTGLTHHFFNFWHSGAARAPERQKLKNGWLDQYGPERFGRLTLLQSEKCGAERVNGEYLLNQTWHRQSGKGVGKCEGSPTLPQNFNFGPQAAQNRTGGFTHPHYFVLSLSITHPLCGINVAPHSDSRWNGIGFVCS